MRLKPCDSKGRAPNHDEAPGSESCSRFLFVLASWASLIVSVLNFSTFRLRYRILVSHSASVLGVFYFEFWHVKF